MHIHWVKRINSARCKPECGNEDVNMVQYIGTDYPARSTKLTKTSVVRVLSNGERKTSIPQIVFITKSSSNLHRNTGRKSLRLAGIRQMGHLGSLMTWPRIQLLVELLAKTVCETSNSFSHSVQNTCPHDMLLADFGGSKQSGHSYVGDCAGAFSLTTEPAFRGTGGLITIGDQLWA